MSQQRSRSPLHSRPSTIGRRDAYYDEQYHMHSGHWRSSENVDNRNAEIGVCWDNGSSQAEDQVDHWAKFIEAIGRAEKRQTASMSRCHTQDDIQDIRQDSAHSPRQLPRERLSSPEALQYSMETHQRIHSPGQRRNHHDVDRRYSRDSSPRYLQGRSHNRMEHGDQNKVHEDRRERGSYIERSLKSNYMEPHLNPKQFEDLDPLEEYIVLHRGFGPRTAPVIVEHDHGIPKHDSRSHNAGRKRERPTSLDSAREHGDLRKHGSSRGRERPRSREPSRDQEYSRFGDPGRAREYPKSHDPVVHHSHLMSHDPFRDQEFPRGSGPVRHQEHPRSRDLPRDRDYPKSRELQRGRDSNRRREPSRSNELQHRERDYNHQPATSRDGHSGFRDDTKFHTSSAKTWKEEMHPREHVTKGNPERRNSNHPEARVDFSSYETLKIKVDMSRPVGQSSHLGYSTERQLSLDLVNVGRQRLDFLPMLEHSGTFTETAMHSGTFAQEIITLVHLVKENYFQGQGMPLNERFSNEQEYSLMDEFVEDEQEMESIGPVVNRPRSSSDTQIFCKIDTLQRKPHFPAPGDLRHDLERRRQERLEGVKITIAGQNFSQILPQSQEIESVYAGDEDPCEVGWSIDEPQQPERWQEETSQKRPAPNTNSRWCFKQARHRQGPRMKRNTVNGAQW